MNVALVAGLVITSLLAGCEGQAVIKGQNVMYQPGTKGDGFYPGGGGVGYFPNSKGGMKGGGYKGFPQVPQQPQFPIMPQQVQYPFMGQLQRPGQEQFMG